MFWVEQWQKTFALRLDRSEMSCGIVTQSEALSFMQVCTKGHAIELVVQAKLHAVYLMAVASKII
jgi:hypothetical protein